MLKQVHLIGAEDDTETEASSANAEAESKADTEVSSANAQPVVVPSTNAADPGSHVGVANAQTSIASPTNVNGKGGGNSVEIETER